MPYSNKLTLQNQGILALLNSVAQGNVHSFSLPYATAYTQRQRIYGLRAYCIRTGNRDLGFNDHIDRLNFMIQLIEKDGSPVRLVKMDSDKVRNREVIFKIGQPEKIDPLISQFGNLPPLPDRLPPSLPENDAVQEQVDVISDFLSSSPCDS